MKRTVCTVMFLIFFAAFSLVCFAEGSAEQAASADDEGPTPLVVLSTRARFDKPDSPIQKEVYEKIKEVVGIDIRPITVPGAQLDTRANLMLASREQLDWIPYRNRQGATMYYSQGATITISEEMFKQHAPTYWSLVNPTTLATTKLKYGDYLGIGVETSVTHTGMLEVRGDWVEKAGMELPDSIEEFEAYLDWALKNDPDGNGKDDTIAFISSSVLELLTAIAPTYLKHGYSWWENDEGKLVPAYVDPDFPKVIAKLREWNEKGYQYTEDFVAQQQQKLDFVAQNRVAANASLWTSYVYEGMDVLAKTMPEARLVPVVLKGAGVNGIQRKSRFHSAAQITSMCKNPEAVLKYYDFTSTVDGFLTVWYGIEDKSYTYDREANVITMLDESGKPTQDRMQSGYALFYHFGTIRPTTRPTPVIDTLLNRLINALDARIESLPNFYPVDVLTPYDQSTWKSQARLGDLETFMTEQIIGLITGKRPLSDWDAIVDEWRSIGGDVLIEDKTAQYAESS